MSGPVQGNHDSLMRLRIPRSQKGPIRATYMPGDPTMSSQIFSFDEPGNVQPICSQASGTNRIILPNELPHIYPGIRSATPSDQQGGSKVAVRPPTDNYVYISQKPNMGNRTFAKRSPPSDWEHQESPKKSRRNETGTRIDARWEDRSIDTKPINSRKESGMGDQDKAELKEKNSLEKYFVGSDFVPRYSIPCMTINSEKTQSRNQNEGDSLLSRGGELVDTYVSGEDNSHLRQHSTCPNKVKLPNEKDQMELMWQEMREKFKKDKLREKFDIIDKIQKMIRKKSRKSGRDGRNKNRNTIEGRPCSTSLGKSRYALNAKIPHLSTSSSSGSFDEMNQSQSTTVSDASDDQRNLKHISRPTHGEFQPKNMLWSRIGSFKEISPREVSSTRQKKRRGRPKSGFTPRPPPAHTGSPVLREFVDPYKVTSSRKRNSKTLFSGNEPLDLRVSSPLSGRPKPITEQALDLSVKASGNARTVSEITCRPEQRPTNENKGAEASALNNQDDVGNSDNKRSHGNEERAPKQCKRDIVEASISSPMPNTDDDTEVASLHVSLYMKTPRIARAQVTSSTLSPYIETSTKVKEHMHGTQVNFTAAPNEMASTSSMKNTESLPSTSCKELNFNNEKEPTQCKNCSSLKQGENQHFIPVAEVTSGSAASRKKGLNEKNRPRKYTKTLASKSHIRVPKYALKSNSPCRNEFPEGVTTTDTSKSIGFSNSQRQTHCRLEKPRNKRISECPLDNEAIENRKDQVRNETSRRISATLSTPTPLGNKSKRENSAETGRYPVTFPVATPTKTGKNCSETKRLSLNKCNETIPPSWSKKSLVETHPKSKGWKRIRNEEVTSTRGRECQGLEPTGDETNDIEVIEDQPSKTAGRVEDSFNAIAFLKTKKKEAFEIKLKGEYIMEFFLNVFNEFSDKNICHYSNYLCKSPAECYHSANKTHGMRETGFLN